MTIAAPEYSPPMSIVRYHSSWLHVTLWICASFPLTLTDAALESGGCGRGVHAPTTATVSTAPAAAAIRFGMWRPLILGDRPFRPAEMMLFFLKEIANTGVSSKEQ
jgi:hypothetical protein